MILRELFTEGMAYKKQGNKVTRKFRCTTGPRKGRVMASPTSCNAPYNFKAGITLKKTKTSQGGNIKVKTRRTKSFNPVSKRVSKLNKPRRRKIS